VWPLSKFTAAREANVVSRLERWLFSQYRIHAAHLTAYRGIIEKLDQVEIDALHTAFVANVSPALRI
jgi:hypothetical protein